MAGIDVFGKSVLVMGLGLHGGGLGVTRWLVRQGAKVTVTDLKKAEQLKETLKALEGEPVEFILGEHRDSDFVNADLIVRNPGVPSESKFLALARQRGIPVRMELGLFFDQLPRGPEQVIGITGTKGKTTTALMVGEMLKRANAKTVVAGNLRVSALELLPEIDAETPVVLEMSSFQLEEFEGLPYAPHVAAITNILPDHLDRYSDLSRYADAKANIFRHQLRTDSCVLNFDNPILTRLRALVPSQVVWFSARRPLNEGAFLERGRLMWAEGGDSCEILPIAELGTAGSHNVENALAAVAAAKAWGAETAPIAGALRDFRGTPHRLEFIRELGGVTFINDTTATAPAATIAGLKTLSARGKNIFLIAGGSDKGLDYAELAQVISQIQPKIILLGGTATEKIERALENARTAELVIVSSNTLEDAVAQATQRARSGDIVLLSPAAASFGMFANEFDRGDKFREIVMGL